MAYLGDKSQFAREAKLLRHNAAMALEGAQAMKESGNRAAAKAMREQADNLNLEASEMEARAA